MKKLLVFILLCCLSCSRKYPLELGSGYYMNYDSNSYFHIVDENNTIIIDSHIVDYFAEGSYIAIVQKPVAVILKNTYNDSNMNFRNRKSFFENSTVLQYWIIDKVTKKIYGPFKKSEFMTKSQELSIGDSMFNKDVN